MIVGRDQGRAGFLRQFLADGYAIFTKPVVGNDFAPARPRRFHFGARRIQRHRQRRRDSQRLRRDRHRLRVIAGRERHHAARAVFFRDRIDEIRRAAELERAALLHVFALEEGGRRPLRGRSCANS